MEKCKCCGFLQTEEKWMDMVGYYDHSKTGIQDPSQYVECPMCQEVLHIDYDIISESRITPLDVN
jgi:hypothetical protein